MKMPPGRKIPGGIQLVEKVFFEYFLGAAHASLSVAKLWSASEVRKVIAWERALPSPLPRFFEKNRVKLLIFRTFLYYFNASADSYVSVKLVFRQSECHLGFSPGRHFYMRVILLRRCPLLRPAFASSSGSQSRTWRIYLSQNSQLWFPGPSS